MGDDLAAFFAKKAQKKSKKKNIVNLDDVGQQLERRVRIQENGEAEVDENEAKETKNSENSIKLITSAEDSEWIEHTEKPSLVGLTFKEFTENPDEFFEEEKKRGNTESVKTWQLPTDDVPVEVPKPPQPKTYQAPHARRDARLDIRSEEMFPSIADADVIVEKLKVEEKKKAATPVVTPQEDQFQEAATKKFRPRVFDNESGGNRGTPMGGGGYRSEMSGGGGYRSEMSGGGYRSEMSGGGGYRNEQSDRTQRFAGRSNADSSDKFGEKRSEERSVWRSANNVPAATPTSQSSGRAAAATSTPYSEDVSNWRSTRVAAPSAPRSFRSDPPAAAATPSPAPADTGCWRSGKSAAAATPSPANAAPQTKSDKYIPPWKRGMT